jgi:hypothetical protein
MPPPCDTSLLLHDAVDDTLERSETPCLLLVAYDSGVSREVDLACGHLLGELPPRCVKCHAGTKQPMTARTVYLYTSPTPP